MSVVSMRVAAGIIRRDDSLLLVQQEIDGVGRWSLPGGVVEDGESILEGLRREIFEESGISVLRVGPLAHVTELCTMDFTSTASVFEIEEWRPSVSPVVADPDGEVVRAEFFTVSEAIRLFAELPLPYMSEPITEYLQGYRQTFYSFRTSDLSGDLRTAQRT